MTIGLAYARPLLIAGACTTLRFLCFSPLPTGQPLTRKEHIPSPPSLPLTPLRTRAVYTHLLVLSSSNDQVFWRWGNVFLVQLLWAIEIRLGQHLDDDETTAVAAAEEVEGGGGGGGGASASAGGATSSGGVGGGGGEGGGGGVATSSAVSGGGGGGGGSLSSSSKAAPAPVMVAAASTSGPSSVGGGSGVKWKGE